MRSVRPIRRHLRIKGQISQETSAQRMERQAVKYIQNLPQYDLILEAIRGGAPNAVIARYGIERDFFNVNERTAIAYLQYFRRVHPALCRPVRNRIWQDSELADLPNYDADAAAAMIGIDPETELLKLIAMQKARLAIEINNERQLSKLFSSTHKDVQVLKELIVELARMRGIIGPNVNLNFMGYDENVRSDLAGIKQDESQRQILSSVVRELRETV